MPPIPYMASPCPGSPCPPYMANTPSQHDQHLNSNAKAQRDQERLKMIQCLAEKLKHDFSKLELPGVIRNELRREIYSKFRESRDATHFVELVEKDIKTHDPDLPINFKLDNESKEKVKQIPCVLALEYIIEQRTEGHSLTDKASPMGFNAIAGILKEAMGFGYAKGSCQKYYNEWRREQQNQGLLQERFAQTRRPHSPEKSTPCKTPRRSEMHLTPGWCSTQSDSPLTAVAAEEDTTMGNAGVIAAYLPPHILQCNGLSSEELLMCTQLKQVFSERTRSQLELESQLERDKYEESRRQSEKEKKDLKAELNALRETSLRAMGLMEQQTALDKDLIAKLQLENGQLRAENSSITGRLNEERAAKSILQNNLLIALSEKAGPLYSRDADPLICANDEPDDAEKRDLDFEQFRDSGIFSQRDSRRPTSNQ